MPWYKLYVCGAEESNMKVVKPSIPKGTRDFGPEEVRKRSFIFGTLREVFVRYGFQPIETPTMENLTTLTGKYGAEGDQLLFKVLNNGDFLRKANKEALEAQDSSSLLSSISKRGLRYDLTVPLARYVVQHQNGIAFPFKRYQIQPVWRADRPQKGRYQEFFQCDVDVIGTNSLMCEAELVQIYDEAFAKLGIRVNIRLNHRKILEGVAEYCGYPDQTMELSTAIDKLDKHKDGWAGVCRELEERGIAPQAHAKIQEALQASSLDSLREILSDSVVGLEGIAELETVLKYLEGYEVQNSLVFDFTLARGLSYYTGCIFEVVVDTEEAGQEEIRMGSIGGGGRYADLTQMFGLKDMPGVGISFGAERIYDVMEDLALFPVDPTESSQILLIGMDGDSHFHAFQVLRQLRSAGINAELYPEPVKMKKQMKYANARQFPYVGIIGEQERQDNNVALKNMSNGEQSLVSVEELIATLKG